MNRDDQIIDLGLAYPEGDQAGCWHRNNAADRDAPVLIQVDSDLGYWRSDGTPMS